MPQFAASLRSSPTVVDITASNGIMTIGDRSNYIASTEDGHEVANFSNYKKVSVYSIPEGNYVYSTIGDGDEAILTPDNYPSTTPIDTVYNYTKDGVYDVTLKTVPTWLDIKSETFVPPVLNATSTNFHCISVLDTAHAFVCGDGKDLRKSNNAGVTWYTLTTGMVAGDTLYCVDFISYSVGFCCGVTALGAGVVYKSTNSAANWTSVLSVASTIFTWLNVLDANNIIVCGFHTGTLVASIWKTTDGGTTWTAALPVGTDGMHVKSRIYFLSTLVGYMTQYQNVLKTIDGGATWSVVLNNAIAYFHGIDFYDVNTGFCTYNSTSAIGASSGGAIFKTSNAGASWVNSGSGAVFSTPGDYIKGAGNVYFKSTNVLLACVKTDADNGLILKSIDGGTTWYELNCADVYPCCISGYSDLVLTCDSVKTISKYYPTYNTYDTDDCVYRLGSFYQASASNYNEDPLTATTYWSLIDEEDLPGKYNTTESIAIIDSLEDCFAKKVYDIECMELSECCKDKDLCANKKWTSLSLLDAVIQSVPVTVDLELWDRTDDLINTGLDVCSCCK